MSINFKDKGNKWLLKLLRIINDIVKEIEHKKVLNDWGI